MSGQRQMFPRPLTAPSRFPSLVATYLWEGSHLQDGAHAGRTYRAQGQPRGHVALLLPARPRSLTRPSNSLARLTDAVPEPCNQATMDDVAGALPQKRGRLHLRFSGLTRHGARVALRAE